MDVSLRPPAGFYISNASGPPPLELDASAFDTPLDPWRPRAVASPWADDCPGAPSGQQLGPSIGDGRASAPFN
eukprot:8494975-Alexandrium_andersonii.AAC.1